MRIHRIRRHASAALGLLCAQAGCAAMVTVHVSAPAGAAAQDTVIVFDPLDAAPGAGHDTAIIDQIDKSFVPRISVVRTGTAVTFPNSDRIRHQVYSFSPAKTFTLKLYAGSPSTAVVFDRPGLVVLGCNIHDQMAAFVGVVDSPYFAKTSASGSASIDLPSGHYRLRAWRPDAAAIPMRDLTVASAPLNVALAIDVDAAAAAPTPWPE